MQVTQYRDGMAMRIEKHPISDAQLKAEYGYVMAQRALEKMLDAGLIYEEEFHQITRLNRQSFSPLLAGIMPENR